MSDTAPEAADAFEAEFDSARDAEYEDAPETEQADEGDEPVVKPAKAPLSPEELDKRYRDSTKALKNERKARQALADEVAALKANVAPPTTKADVGDDLDLSKLDINGDPLGALEKLKAFALKYQQGETQTVEQRRAAEKANAEIQALQTWGGEQEDEFREDHADYDDAAKHFAETRTKELLAEGYSKAEVRAQFGKELADITRRAQKNDRNPAEIIYGLAKNRGFGRSSTGKALDKVAAGQEASRSLSSGGGKPSSGAPLTPGQVANLKGAAFDKAFDALRASERRRG